MVRVVATASPSLHQPCMLQKIVLTVKFCTNISGLVLWTRSVSFAMHGRIATAPQHERAGKSLRSVACGTLWSVLVRPDWNE